MDRRQSYDREEPKIRPQRETALYLSYRDAIALIGQWLSKIPTGVHGALYGSSKSSGTCHHFTRLTLVCFGFPLSLSGLGGGEVQTRNSSLEYLETLGLVAAVSVESLARKSIHLLIPQNKAKL